jgi:hypothetical protein
MSDLPEGFEQLSARVDALEKRVHDLEQSYRTPVPFPEQEKIASVQVQQPAVVEQEANVFPVLGRAMLGIAGAYLLRAIADLSPIPRVIVSGIAITYSIAWLAWAARTRARRFASAVYAATSVLILAPMLWELTLRYRLLSPAWAAAILALFALISSVLSWRQEGFRVSLLAHGAAAATAFALLIATDHMLPFIAALLLMVLIGEYGGARQRRDLIRPLVAGIADLSIGLLIFVYSGPADAHAAYPALSTADLCWPACVLFVIAAAGVIVRTAVLRQTLSVFEIAQNIVAFLLLAASVVVFTHHSGKVTFGLVCIALSVVCNVAAFTVFLRDAETRNFRTFAIWGGALALAGAWWSFSSNWNATFLGLAALLASALAVALNRSMLDFEADVFLAAAAISSGLLVYVFHTLAGPLPAKPLWGVYLVSLCAIFCYAVEKTGDGASRAQQLLHFIPALIAACAVAALLAQGLLRLLGIGFTPGLHQVALVRTLALCGLALVLAFSGTRWRRIEMTRIAYGVLVFVAGKLLFEDLRHGRMEFAAASIFLFAITLIAVPRIATKKASIQLR